MNGVLGAVGEVFWSRSFAGRMGRILGALSIISLMRYAFHFGLSATFHEILSYYATVLNIAFGWLDPSVKHVLAYVLKSLKIEIHFSEMWRHIFLLMWILFFRDATVALFDRRPVTAAVRLIVGVLIAVVVSIFASSSYSHLSSNIQNGLIASLPTCGLFLYDVLLYLYSAIFQIHYLNRANQTPGRSRIRFLKNALLRASHRFFFVLIVIGVCFLLPWVRALPAPAGGFLVLIFATFANSSYWLWRGAKYAYESKTEGSTWFETFKESEAGRFGIAVTSVFAWILVFVVLNTGLKEVGL